jgi:hypothetical protein
MNPKSTDRPIQPPLAKPDSAIRQAHLNRPPLLRNYSPKPAAVPPQSPKSPVEPGQPVKELKRKSTPAAPAPRKPPPDLRPEREYFCRTCDRRITARWPPVGWLNLRRHIYRKSIALPEGLTEREQKVYRKRVTMGLGLFCGWNCLLAAMPRLGALCAELNERGIGLRRLAPGEQPANLLSHATKGGPQ